MSHATDSAFLTRNAGQILADGREHDLAGRSSEAMECYAAVIDVTPADQSRVTAGCRTRGNHVKMPWRAAGSGLKCAIPL